MKKTIWRSIGAVLAGFLIGAILAVGTDLALNAAGILNMESFKENAPAIIFMVIVYRLIYNIVGCYVAAKLAPNKPMKHALIIGFTGTVLAIVGSAVMWDQAVAWYNISVILISLPSAWIGAKLVIAQNSKRQAIS